MRTRFGFELLIALRQRFALFGPKTVHFQTTPQPENPKPEKNQAGSIRKMRFELVFGFVVFKPKVCHSGFASERI